MPVYKVRVTFVKTHEFKGIHANSPEQAEDRAAGIVHNWRDVTEVVEAEAEASG